MADFLIALSSSGNAAYARPFTTGSNAGGYSLESIDVGGGSETDSLDTTVTLRGADADGAMLDAALATFSNPADWGSDENTFALATPYVLDPDARYFIHFQVGDETIFFTPVAGTGADTGSAEGWTFDHLDRASVMGTH